MDKIKIKWIIFSVVALIIFIPTCVSAATYLYYDASGMEYYLYSDEYSGTCEYAINGSETTSPLIFDACTNPSTNFILELSSVSGKYLWLAGASSGLDLSLVEVFYSDAYVNTLGSNISLIPGIDHIMITDNTYASYEYIIVKVDDTLINGTSYANFWEIVNETAGLSVLASTNPLAALNKMITYQNDYDALFMNLSGWLPVVDNMIYMPLDASKNDEYVVWVRGLDPGTTYDVVFMISDRDEEIIPYELNGVDRLPYTGTDLTLFIIVAANAILIPVIYHMKRKYRKISNEIK